MFPPVPYSPNAPTSDFWPGPKQKLLSRASLGLDTGQWVPPGLLCQGRCHHGTPTRLVPQATSFILILQASPLRSAHSPASTCHHIYIKSTCGVQTGCDESDTQLVIWHSGWGSSVCACTHVVCTRVSCAPWVRLRVCALSVHWTEEAPLSHAQHRAWHRACNSKYLCKWIEHCTVWHVCSIFSLCSNIEFFNFPRRSQQGRWSWWSGWPGPRPPTGKPAGPSLFSPPLVLLWPATPSSTVCSGYLSEITLVQTLAPWFEPCPEVGDCGYRRWHPREDEVGGALRTWLFLVWSMHPMSSLPTWLPVAGRGRSLRCEASATETLQWFPPYYMTGESCDQRERRLCRHRALSGQFFCLHLRQHSEWRACFLLITCF